VVRILAFIAGLKIYCHKNDGRNIFCIGMEIDLVAQEFQKVKKT
jgi:hypothetical protein